MSDILRDRPSTAATIAADIVLEGVFHDYHGVPALRGVDIAVKPAEVVCLLGPSGCGKTTLLRIAAGLERPRAGTVRIGGQVVASDTVFVPPERRGVGLMFQDFALFPHLTNLANVAFGLDRLARAEARAEALRALERVGLGRHAEDYPERLSGGEQQRVALARALAPRPGVMLMDEPFSGLDRRLRDAVRDETLSVLRRAGATVIVVTHDPEEALRVADRVVLMRRGRIVQIGAPRQIYRSPIDLETARFFTDLNEIAGRAREGRITTPLGAWPAGEVAEGGEAVVVIRPESIAFRRAGGTPADGAIQGVIRAERFLGGTALVEIAVEGLERPLNARVPSSDEWRAGDTVEVEVARGEVLVFATPPA